MGVGDVVRFSTSIKRWAEIRKPGVDVTASGVILDVIYHDILDVAVYEVMWAGGKIDRHYSSGLVPIKS
jgi:hypothetical protein